MRYDPFDNKSVPFNLDHCSLEYKKNKAKEKLRKFIANHPERMVSGSDDSTMFLWNLPRQYTPKARMVGHSLPIIEVCFSPSSNWLVSASFDQTIKLWNGFTGHFIAAFLGHTAPIYTCSWSPDNTMVASGSRDGLVKIWNVVNKKLVKSLTGHKGDVFVVEWSPDGSAVVSGGKDGSLKLWSVK
jgi:ribosome assembly protein 4